MNRNVSPFLNFFLFSLFFFLLTSCPQPDGSSHGTKPVNPVKPDRTLVVFDNTHGLCTAVAYDDYRRRNEDKIAEVPAGRRSAEIEYYPGDSTPFYFAYIISLNDFSDFTMNYVPQNGMDQRTVNVADKKTTTVLIPKLDETFSSDDQLLSPRSFLLLQNVSSYSFELHQGRSSVKPDGAISSPVVNSSEKAFYTIKPNSSEVYSLLVGADYKDFPSSPENFRAGYFYNFTYNGNIVWDREIPVKIDNIVIKTYTVTFNANGGAGNPPDSQIASASSVVTLPNGGGLSKQGYTFGGWNASATGTEINNGAGASYTVTGDISLYATWYPIGTIIYTVDFDSGGGSVVASQDIISGKQAFRPADPIRRGYIFINWYADPGFNKVYDFSKPVIDYITIYAKWEAIRYTVTFNSNEGIGTAPASQTVDALSSITLPNGNGLSKTGYSFNGWSLSDSGTSAYDVGDSFTVEGDITLFAVWDILPYTVNFYSNGGSAVQRQNVTYGSRAVKPADPARNGYKFVGWYVDTRLMEEYDFSSSVIGNVVLYAKWDSLVNGIRLNKSTITLDVNEKETLNASMNTGNAIFDTITWSSGNTSIATVSQNGTITAINGGTTVITASAGGGSHTAQCTVTVINIVNLSAIPGVPVPATGATQATTITETEQYTGTVSWSPAGTFAALTQYTATITLTAKTGYTMRNVPTNFFTVNGAITTNSANSGVVTAVFPVTVGSNDELQAYLSGLPANTADTPYAVALNMSSLTGIRGTLDNNSTKYVYLDLSGSTVTTIGESAFYGCTSLTGVIIGSGVTKIDSQAFVNCTSLTNVTIGNSVTSIGSSAFRECANLASVTIPDSVITIGDYAFQRSGLTGITIPNSVESIGKYAFSPCASLTNVNIGNSISTIGEIAFGGAILTAINVDAANTAYSSTNGVLYNKDKTVLINYPHGKIGAFTIPNGVITIGDNAFYGCTSLTDVTIPNSVTTIEMWAFDSCHSLTSVIIPNSVITVKYLAFGYCRNLADVIIGNGVTSIGNEAFRECPSLTSLTIGNKVTSIGQMAFYNCSSLTGVTIPDSVTSIGSAAFAGCANLTRATIGNSVTTIGTQAFQECTSLTSVIIGNSVTSIGGNAFYNCTSLTSVVIPNSVTSIEYYTAGAFQNCINLTSVIIIGNGTTRIGQETFRGCTSLASVTIGSGVTRIDSQAFADCTSLISVTFQGTIDGSYFYSTNIFPGDLRNKFYATNSTNGTPGTYTRAKGGTVWTKQ